VQEEVSNTLLQIDGKTCILEKENDPTKLRCTSVWGSAVMRQWANACVPV
jgi:hypothetical protein